MWDDEDDFDDEDIPTMPRSKKGNKWMVIGAFFELLTDILKSLAKFTDTLTDESLAKFRYERNRQDFIQQASREIEMLTSGEYDATTAESSGSVGSRRIEPPN